MPNIYPKIQIFDFVPRIQVWSVTPDYIELFWYPIPKELARTYRVYFDTTYGGAFGTMVKEVPNNWQTVHGTIPNTKGFMNGVVFTRIPKSDLGQGDVTYYFKVTVVAPDGTEFPKAQTPVKPIFSILENRIHGRLLDTPLKTNVAFYVTIPAGSTYTDNYWDIQYLLGRVASTLDIEVDDSDILFKINNINNLPIFVKSGESAEVAKNGVEVSKLFIANNTVEDATVQILATG